MYRFFKYTHTAKNFHSYSVNFIPTGRKPHSNITGTIITNVLRYVNNEQYTKQLNTFASLYVLTRHNSHGKHNYHLSTKQRHLILTTQGWKRTLPPSDRILYYTSASV